MSNTPSCPWWAVFPETGYYTYMPELSYRNLKGNCVFTISDQVHVYGTLRVSVEMPDHQWGVYKSQLEDQRSIWLDTSKPFDYSRKQAANESDIHEYVYPSDGQVQYQFLEGEHSTLHFTDDSLSDMALRSAHNNFRRAQGKGVKKEVVQQLGNQYAQKKHEIIEAAKKAAKENAKKAARK